MNTVELPNGQSIDFGHLLAAMNLVYRGMPITGSWGGDCMQLAQVYAGQASDADGYASLMQQTFAIEDDGSASKFGDQDLRADLDSVVAGAELKSGSNVADVLRNYYTNLTDYDRCYQFIAMSFGSMNTSDSEAFRNKVYSTMTADAGMQLLLYMNGMWSSSGWQVDADAEPALRGACNELADYLSRAVNGEKVKKCIQHPDAHDGWAGPCGCPECTGRWGSSFRCTERTGSGFRRCNIDQQRGRCG